MRCRTVSLHNLAILRTLCLKLWLLPSLLLAQSLTWIGEGEFVSSSANGVSADGTVVVGFLRIGTSPQAFRWKPNEGVQLLGTLGGTRSFANAVSADGRVVVGTAGTADGVFRAFRWSEAEGMHALGSSEESVAIGVSADGRVIVGGIIHENDIWDAFRWEHATGMEILTTRVSQGVALGVSADGNTVVGDCAVPGQSIPMSPFRWTRFTGLQYIIPFVDGSALSISPDGRAIVGVIYHGSYATPRGFYWSYLSWSYVWVGDFGGGTSEALGVSLSGAVTVGRAKTQNGEWRAFRWTPSQGLEDLNQTYSDLLAPCSSLQVANSVSWDGRYIVGQGFNSASGRPEGFLLDTWRYGDTNGDGCLDDSDLLNLLIAFGTQGSGLTRHEDINKDGIVDGTNLLILLLNFGEGC